MEVMSLLVQILLAGAVLAAIVGAQLLASKKNDGWGWLLVFAVIAVLCLSGTTVDVVDNKECGASATPLVVDTSKGGV